MSGHRSVRVVPDVAGIEAEFDYLVPAGLREAVSLGAIVRVPLQGRRVRGWVVDNDALPPDGVRLLELLKVSGAGPSPELLELSSWAAWRWAGKRSFFLQTSSPPKVVSRLPAKAMHAPAQRGPHFAEGISVLCWPPAVDPLPLALEADDAGPALILVPTLRAAARLVRRMKSEGRSALLHPDLWAQEAAGGVTVVGTRAAAWTPLPDLRAVLVLDAHDEGFQSERSPTWNAVEVALERARRRGIPALVSSPVPRADLLPDVPVGRVDRSFERQGWAPLHVVDLRHTDPRTGLYSPALVELIRGDKRVVCVLNRKGRAQLLVCTACDEVARCERCGGALAMADDAFRCRRCETSRPVICGSCGSALFKQLRPGVSRVREDLESLALQPVGEVSGDSGDLPSTAVLVGTEAVLHRVGKADAVVFLDFDQELLTDRQRGAEDALILLARASRIVGGRRGSGIVMVQTRQPDSEVVVAALHGDPIRLRSAELERRKELGWPPYRALAVVSGTGADQYVNRLPANLDVVGPMDGRWLLRASSPSELADSLALVPHPGGKLRIQVDPPRV